MKATGIVRKLDALGHVSIPSELRKTLEICPGDSMEFYTDGQYIVLAKYTPGCLFCGSIDHVIEHSGERVCPNCIEELRSVREEMTVQLVR